MNVGIDTFGCDHGRSGLGSYLFSLVSNLTPSDTINYELFGAEMDRYTYTSEKGLGFSSVNIPDSEAADRLWHLFNLNGFARHHKYDVILYPSAGRILPVKYRTPGIAVVNNIVSELITSKNDAWLRWQTKKGLANANRVIAASQYVRKDLERSGVNPEKIEVIHNGIDHSLFYPRPLLNADTVDIKPFAIKRPYIIYASRLSAAGKKHVELIKAFTLFKEKTHLPHRLVLAGSDGEYSEEVHKAAFNSSAASDIFLTGFFPHESLPELYSGADACIFPSVTEGVGLPVIEAMATGIPVACAKAGALGEIAGNCALYFNPDDAEETAFVIEKIVTDQAQREKLITAGLEWTKRFSWEKTAEKTVALLSQVASEK